MGWPRPARAKHAADGLAVVVEVQSETVRRMPAPWRHVAYSPQLTAVGATWQVHAHGSAQSQGALLAAVAPRGQARGV